MHRTTVMLDDALYRRVKREAVDRGRPMRVLVEQAIRMYLAHPARKVTTKTPKFGVYPMRVKGSLRRKDIYAYLDEKYA